MAAKSKKSSKPAVSKPAVEKKYVAPSVALTNTFSPGFWQQNWMPALSLMLLAFALYAIGLNYGYVLDDELIIWKNDYVQDGFSGLGRIFSTDSFMGYFKEQKFLLEGGRYRPLSLATFAMEVDLFGPGKTTISHIINVLLYGFTGILLYQILLGLFKTGEGGKWYFSLPFIAALVFVMHPLHVECVANIKGRDEILALLFSLAALWAMLKHFDTNRSGWLVGSASFLLLGMLAKENALTFVVVIPLTVALFTPVSRSRAIGAALPLALAALLFIIIRYQALGYMLDHGKASTDIMNNPFLGMSLSEKFATIFLTLGWYIKLLFVPYPLTIDYYPYHVPKVDWSDWRALLSLVAYVGLGVWAIRNLKKHRIPAYSILYFVITLSIVSNLFVSVGTFMNERFLYMPSVAFSLLAAWFFARKLPEWIKEKPDAAYPLGMIVVAAIAGLYAFVTIKRIPDWQDGLTINKAAVRVSPGSCRSHTFYVTGLYDNVYKTLKKGDDKKALVDTMEFHINEALKINPDYTAALIMKSAVAAARFDIDNQLDKLFHQFEAVMEKIPYNSNFRSFLDQYMVYLNGSNSDKYIAFCYRVGYEFFYQKKKDYNNAIHFLKYGLDRQTEDIRILESMAEVYAAYGKTKEANAMRQRAEAQK
ncbi:MAG: hypothetical protein JNJ57_03325 [Saprospiraceae bacterium]|nr:hypothetical protein [Saprospiraceae bacterium]